MELELVIGHLNEAGVSVWLDSNGKLRIDKDASPELKAIVREHNSPLMEWIEAVAFMNVLGMRTIRLPLGHLALAYPLGADQEQIAWAVKVLRLDSMPLVINDEHLSALTWDEWKRRQPLWTRRLGPARSEIKKERKLEFGRKTA